MRFLSAGLVTMVALSGCHWLAPKTGYMSFSVEPVNPHVGAHVTMRLIGPLNGPYPVRNGDVFEVFIDTDENPWLNATDRDRTKPYDGGVKLGEFTIQAGGGSLEVALQPSYGPDKYGHVIRVVPGGNVALRVTGNHHTLTRGVQIMPLSAPAPSQPGSSGP